MTASTPSQEKYRTTTPESRDLWAGFEDGKRKRIGIVIAWNHYYRVTDGATDHSRPMVAEQSPNGCADTSERYGFNSYRLFFGQSAAIEWAAS